MTVIPKGVQRWVSSSKTAEFVENTIFAVSVETAMKMVGRPAFIMMDKEADSPEKKKYAAVKEMLYQGICLGLYLSAMRPVKHFFYNIISKMLNKGNPKNATKLEAFNRQNKFIEDQEKELKKQLKDFTDKVKKKEFKNTALDRIIQLKENMRSDKNLRLGKGAKEMAAIVGSILMLTVVAPQISHFIIHPVMSVLGFKDTNHDPKNKEQKPKEIANA